MAWEGEGDFRGDHLIFGRTKGGSVLTENPKAVIAENFGRIRGGGGGTQICLENEDGGDRESHQKASLQ